MNDVGSPQDFNALTDDEFRTVARRFVEEHYPPELRNPLRRLHWRENRPWYMILARAWLARAGLAARVRRHGPLRRQAAHPDRGVRAVRLRARERHGRDHARSAAHPLRHTGAEGLLPAEDPRRRAHLVPGLLRAQRRLRPRVAAHRGGARRRSLGRQRPEDLDHARQRRQLDLPAGAHRQERQEAGRHQLPAGADGQPRHHRAADRQPRPARRVLRGVLRQRARAEGEPGRRGQQGLDHGEGAARLRAHRHRLAASSRPMRSAG